MEPELERVKDERLFLVPGSDGDRRQRHRFLREGLESAMRGVVTTTASTWIPRQLRVRSGPFSIHAGSGAVTLRKAPGPSRRTHRSAGAQTARSHACAPQPALFQFEFDEFDLGRAGVLHRPRLPAVLPDEIAVVRRHAAIGRARHHFGKHAAVDVDPQARCGLRDLSRLPRRVSGRRASRAGGYYP